MLALVSLVVLTSSLTNKAFAQSPIYGQCGGIGWKGAATCTSGSICVSMNPYYSQCIPSGTTTPVSVPTTSKVPTTTSVSTTSNIPKTSNTPTTSSGPTTSKASTTSSGPTPTSGSSCSASRTKFKYFGVNESGAEFGSARPGTLGTDYIWPAPSSIDYFVGKGFNTFRVPFLMERISPPATGLTGPFDAAYLNGLVTTVNYITDKGAYAVIDPHNYLRYNNAVISSTSQFQTWWQNLAAQFKSNTHVIFDIQNEPHDIAAATVFSFNQAAVNGIRASGATSQLILVEGTSWTGAWTWTSSGNAGVFGAIKDPNNNTAIEMHQYLDSDASGTSETCVSPTIGAERLADATSWLKANNLKGFLGEVGGGSNAVCAAAVSGALCSMQESGVWIGALWWAAGPWWGNYFLSIEPSSGVALSTMLPILQSFQ